MIIDAHMHFNHKIPILKDSIKNLADELKINNIERALVLHLENQKWPYDEISKELKNYPNIKTFFNIHPDDQNAFGKLKNAKENLGAIGLKLHPRLQNIKLTDKNFIKLIQYAAFPDGSDLINGFNLMQYVDLAKSATQTKMIWAHMGGHHAIDFAFAAKRLENVYLDISFSIYYYIGSPVVDSILYAIKNLGYNKIFFGSDYPDKNPSEVLKIVNNLFEKHEVSKEDQNKIMYANAKDFFKW